MEDFSDGALERGVVLGDTVDDALAGVVVLVTIFVIGKTNICGEEEMNVHHSNTSNNCKVGAHSNACLGGLSRPC